MEVLREEEARVAHKVEHVPEHLAVAVDEIVLLQAVQHNGNAAAEHLRQPRLPKPVKKFKKKNKKNNNFKN